MLFNTAPFFLFLAVVLALFYASPRALRKYILLVASYFFYGCWNYKFIPLLLTLTAIDYTAGRWLEKVPPGPRRKMVLILSLCANLGFLGFFKFYNFLGSNLAWVMDKPADAFFLNIVLPLGISFHTFQSMSYVIDVYRGQQQVVRNPIDYALFICFFPQLVAGPIVRARTFFHDFFNWQPPSAEDVSRGVLLLALGLTKKMAFADQFAKVANDYFKNVSGNPGMLTAWSGVVAFGMQIYFDFSGYTDMAIGMAKLLGFHFPVNFRRPYLASSITDFWRRWHISLSTWLRDYLYIPLGGNRHGRWMTYRNLMITMLLGGLWHGASWNFVIWGGYHGALLSVERVFRGDRQIRKDWNWLYPAEGDRDFRPGHDRVGFLPRRRSSAESGRPEADVPRRTGASAARQLAPGADWDRAAAGGGGGKTRLVRAIAEGAHAGLRLRAGPDVVLHRSFRRHRRQDSFRVLSVLA